MNLRNVHFAALLALAACGSSAPSNAQEAQASTAGGNGPANLAPTPPPFTTSTVATFDDPWAMAFLPGTSTAIVTEKGGRIWLVDVSNGQKQPVAGAPRIDAAGTNGQGGLLDLSLIHI